jgi:hypothetical protein
VPSFAGDEMEVRGSQPSGREEGFRNCVENQSLMKQNGVNFWVVYEEFTTDNTYPQSLFLH